MLPSGRTCHTLDCGIPLHRIRSWLEEELRLPAQEPETRYLFTEDGASCAVVLKALENRSIGKVSIERTEMAVNGEVDAVDAFMRLFALRFISAGG